MVIMPERTKEELSEEINKLLGTSIDFAKLTKDDLVVLNEALVKFKEAAEFPLPLLDRPIGEILEKKVGDKSLRESTIRDIIGLPKEGGLFGFGILSGRFLKGDKKQESSATQNQKPPS